MNAPLKALETALQYQFKRTELLQTAVTHRSHSSPHNERLEFLGDSVLNCTAAHLLFLRFPQMPEGDLSRLRANLVNKDSLYRVATHLQLGNYLRLGEGELKSGGHQRPSILADACEAIIGAVYLDSSFDTAHALVARMLKEDIESIIPGQPIKDPKTRLQELVQARHHTLPKYTMLGTQGQSHAQHFVVACDIDFLGLRTQGEGTSRRNAEQKAAEAALQLLEGH